MMLFSLVVALVLMGLCSMASAAQNVTNTSQKGSLLIFPKIDTSAIDESGFYRDTIVMIGNDYFTEVWVKCYWVNAFQEIQDFMFRLTPNQPVWFRASDGAGTGVYDFVTSPITVPGFFAGAGVVGELKCWAVDAVGQNQISFNHLYGNAIIFDPVHAAAFEYNAWAFTARGVALNGTVGEPGTLVLSGATGGYDACPSYLVFNCFSKGSAINLPDEGGFATFVNTDLTLVPCNQDLSQDRVPTCTKAKFDIWNENETKYTGAYQCFKCWFEGYLGDIGFTTRGGFGGEKFWYKSLHTTAGRFRVQGVASTVCNGIFPTCTAQVATPLLGLISTEIKFTSDPFDALAGTTPNTAGTGAATTIRWDFQNVPPEAPAQ
jgi:hypothetical protein